MFNKEYNHYHIVDDLKRLLAKGEEREFSSLLMIALLTSLTSTSNWEKSSLRVSQTILLRCYFMFDEEYSHCPIVDDLKRLLAKGEEIEFSGTMWSVNHMHYN
jgi:hypothetical protein